MCGRTTVTISRYEIAQALGADQVEGAELPSTWNLAPTQDLYLVTSEPPGGRKLQTARWGLVPSWAQSPGIGARLINARAETVAERPAFRAALQVRRCLLPVSGFYEWRRPSPAMPGHKQPFYFRRRDGRPMVFAGLWELWRDAQGRPLRSCTIITTTANGTMAPVHRRMPVVLADADWDEWLRPGPIRPERLRQLLAPAPDDLLEVNPVGKSVNDARNDGPDLVSPVAEPAATATLFDS